MSKAIRPWCFGCVVTKRSTAVTIAARLPFMSAAPRPRSMPYSSINGSNGGVSQCTWGPLGTTSVWPAKASTGPWWPWVAQRFSTSPKGSRSIWKPSCSRRSISSAWQPWSSGVIEGRRINSMASCRVEESSGERSCGSVVGMQCLVKSDGTLVGQALDASILGVATQQQVVLAGQLAGSHDLDLLTLIVEQGDLGSGSQVEAGLNGAAVAQRNADAGIGADQAAFAHLDDDVAAAGEGTHGGAAAAEIRALADQHARRDTAFDHAGAFGAGIEIDEAFMHHGGAFTKVGAQAYP